MEKKKYKKTHPFSILKKLKISVVLVLLSIIQQFLYRPRDIVEYVAALGFNAVYAMGIVFYALASYGCYRYRFVEDGIQIRDGLLIKRRFKVPYAKIQTIVFQRDALAALFGAVKVSFDTPAGLSKSYDISAYFSQKNSELLLIKIRDRNPASACVRANAVNTMLMCAFWANPAMGLLVTAPVISRLGDIAGTELTDNILRTQSDFRLRLIALNIPPAAAGVASVLMLGWAISMLVCFMRYARFKAYLQGEYLVLSRGLVNQKLTFTGRSGITAATVDQSLLMHWMGLYTSGIFTIGSGKLKGDKSLLIAPESKKHFYHSLHSLLGITPEERESVYTAPHTLPSYLYFPFFVTALTIAAIMAADYFSVINELFKALLLFLLAPLFWWMLFRVFAHRYAHLGVSDKHLIVCGFSRLTLKTYYIPFDKVQCVEMTQSLPQRLAHTCNVRVYVYFEKRAFHIVKHLPYQRVQAFLANHDTEKNF